MFSSKVLALCVLLCTLGVGLGASIQEILEDGKHSKSDLDNLNGALKNIADRFDNWDAFYMHRLEPRMVGAATSLANLDTNIRNLQERAHVWDTFQLHVSSWNDQIKALDHKVNIINEGYEKLLSLDSQLYSTLRPNGSLSGMQSQMTEFNDKLNGISQALSKETQPIVSEFASRGVLHTVKHLERKIDRLQLAVDRASRAGKLRDVEEVAPNKMTVKCTAPPAVEEILKDVSSKVDAIYDRKSGDQDDVEMLNEPKRRHSDFACKRMLAPYRKLSEGVEYLKSVMADLVDDDSVAPNEKSLSLRHRRRLSALDEVKDTLEDIEKNIAELGRDQHRNVNENEKILRRIERKLDSLRKDEDTEDEQFLKTLSRVDSNLRKAIKMIDDDDDDDSDEKGNKKRKNDSDDDDDDDDNDSDDDDKGKRKNDDSDDDDDDSDDDDDTNKNKRKGRKRGDDDDSDDDDSDDDDDREKQGRRKNKNDSDDDDDDDNRRKGKGKGRNNKDDDDDDDDSDDDDSREKNGKRKNNDDDNSDDDDDDDDDSDDKESNGRRKPRENKNNSSDDKEAKVVASDI